MANVQLEEKKNNIAVNNPISKKEMLDVKLTFKIIFKYFKQFRISFYICLIFSLLTTCFNIVLIIGLGDVSSLINFIIIKNVSSQNPMFPQSPINISQTYFLVFSGIIIIGYFFNALLIWLMNSLVIKVAQKIGYQLRIDLFNKVQLLSVQYFDTHESGNIMSVLTNDVFNLVLFISQNLGQILYGLTTMLGMLIISFLISPYITLIVLGILGLCGSAITFIIKKSGPAFVKQQIKLGEMNGFIEEYISGQNIVNLYSQQHTTEKIFVNLNKELTKQGEKSQSISGLLIPWLNFLMNFIIAVEIIVAISFHDNNISYGSVITSISLIPDKLAELDKQLVELNPNSQNLPVIGLITTLMLATRNFINPINQMIGMVAQFQSAIAGSRRTQEIFDQPNEDKPFENEEFKKDIKGKVEIKNLNFSYVQNKPVLKNVSFTAEPGQTVAIVGPTGSGKTTIINLLTKFYDITDGDIFIDGHDIKKIKKESIRKQVSIVLQDTYLFNASIKENLRYAKPDATDEEIINAAKAADCDDFIMKLENKYDTILTENAQELSSGQKQLLAIARAMLSPSNILILDEATSNIDTRTEKIVQAAMMKLIKNKTSFVIAHRLSTIRNADKIIVLKDGEILEIGNHKELMNKKGFYYNLNMSKTDNLDIDVDN